MASNQRLTIFALGLSLFRTAVIENAFELSRWRALWDELCARQNGTMFQSFAWNETAARVFGDREQSRVVVIESDSGAVILPACVNQSGAGLLGERLFDYRDALSTALELLPRAWEKICCPTSFEVIALRGERAVSRWHPLSPFPFANAPAVLRSSISHDEFLRTHNRLGRHSRRVRKHGIEPHRYSGAECNLVRTIYERKGAQGSAESNLFSDPLRRAFMQEICAHPEVECEVFTYETAGELVAALVTFREGHWRRFYTVYYDQRWGSLSPGQVLLFEITAESLSQGLDCDFMTGEYPYKTRLATDAVQLYRVCATAEQLREAGAGRVGKVLAA